jgi:2-oxoisovalerate dehydrogenase E1 component
MYRTAFALATQARRVVVSIEPIALYHSRDLFLDGDGAWAAPPSLEVAMPFEPRVYEADAPDLTIASYGNGLYMSLRAARRLFQETGARARVLDLRFLCPLPTEAVLHHARETGTLLVVDECRKSGSLSEALAAIILESAAGVRFARVTAADCFVPLGDAANLVLPSEDEIYTAARDLLLLKRASHRPASR